MCRVQFHLMLQRTLKGKTCFDLNLPGFKVVKVLQQGQRSSSTNWRIKKNAVDNRKRKGDRKGPRQDVMLSFTQTTKRCQIEEGDCVRLGGKV